MRRAAPSGTQFVEEPFGAVEAGSLACAVLGLGLADLGQEELPAEEAELLLVALVSLRVHDVGSPPRPLKDNGWLIAGLDLVDDVGHPLPELGDRYGLHDGTQYIRVYRCQECV